MAVVFDWDINVLGGRPVMCCGDVAVPCAGPIGDDEVVDDVALARGAGTYCI